MKILKWAPYRSGWVIPPPKPDSRRLKTQIFSFGLQAEEISGQVVQLGILDDAGPGRHVERRRRTFRVERRDFALAFEDAHFQFVFGVAVGHVDQTGHLLGGLGVGIGYAAFGVGTVTAGTTLFAEDFPSTLSRAHQRRKS